MIDTDAEAHLRELEDGLWQPETRFDRGLMLRVLHPDFVELGRSGRIYDLDATLAAESAPFATELPLLGFTVREPAPDVALVTSVSRVHHVDGQSLAANRSSLWVRHDDGCRLHLHQGTPV